MNTWKDLIRAFGGPSKFARAVGMSDINGRKCKHRNNVHADYWPAIVARAPHAGIKGVTYELLFSLKRGKDENSHNFRFAGHEARV